MVWEMGEHNPARFFIENLAFARNRFFKSEQLGLFLVKLSKKSIQFTVCSL